MKIEFSKFTTKEGKNFSGVFIDDEPAPYIVEEVGTSLHLFSIDSGKVSKPIKMENANYDGVAATIKMIQIQGIPFPEPKE